MEKGKNLLLVFKNITNKSVFEGEKTMPTKLTIKWPKPSSTLENTVEEKNQT